MADELNAIEIDCDANVAQFIFFIRAAFMIDNVMNLVEGVKIGGDAKRLMLVVDPIGKFEELKSIEFAASDLASLYETVLIDTPLSMFFSAYLEESTRELKNYNDV